MNTVYLGLGSNLGDRAENVTKALALLAPEIIVVKISPTYETKPMYLEEQQNFFNAACESKTALSPSEVLKKIKSVEVQVGREESVRNGPRAIDVDLLFYNDEIIDTPAFAVPHARLRERGFVLRPLFDIAPELRDPVTGKTIRELLDALAPEDAPVIVRAGS